MLLTESHHISKNNKFWKECDDLCYVSKNLYNQALYRVNEEYKNNGSYLNYHSLVKQLVFENQVDFRRLPAKVAQQTLMNLDRNWKSFFHG